jgi:hypothetical protein
VRDSRKCSLSGIQEQDCNSNIMNVQCMIQTLIKYVLKVERFTSDIVTLCYIGKCSRIVKVVIRK